MRPVALGLLAIALSSGCQGAQVGGQSGSEGCLEEDDTFRAVAFDGGQDSELADDDAGVIETTAFNDPNQCVER